MKTVTEKILKLILSRATNFKNEEGIPCSYIPDSDYEYLAEKIAEQLREQKPDSQRQLDILFGASQYKKHGGIDVKEEKEYLKPKKEEQHQDKNSQ